MTLPLATLDDFERWPGITFTDDHAASIQFLLEAASARVRQHCGQTWLTDDDPAALDAVPDVVRDVVVEIAAAVWNNPKNLTTETAGPFSAGLNPGDLQLTDEQKERLVPYLAAGGKPALWTQATTRGTEDLAFLSRDCGDTVFLETIPAGDPIPWDAG